MGRRYSGAQTTKGRSAFDLSQGFLTVREDVILRSETMGQPGVFRCGEAI